MELYMQISDVLSISGMSDGVGVSIAHCGAVLGRRLVAPHERAIGRWLREPLASNLAITLLLYIINHTIRP